MVVIRLVNANIEALVVVEESSDPPTALVLVAPGCGFFGVNSPVASLANRDKHIVPRAASNCLRASSLRNDDPLNSEKSARSKIPISSSSTVECEPDSPLPPVPPPKPPVAAASP